ncbi:hypothetical protein Peur_066687 [Populus x canadensis]
MPNDVVLDPIVHHLFAKNQFNRGKSSRSWPLYPRCDHDLSPPRCPPFVKAGTPDLLWLYKSQRKAWKRGGILEEKPRKTEHTKHNPKKIQSQERKTGAKTKAKTPKQRNNTQREGEERNPVYRELFPLLPSSLQTSLHKKNPTQNPDPEFEGEASTVLSSSSQGLRK